MSIEQTQRAIDRYFDVMGADEDLAACFSSDVSWLVAGTGRLVQGADAVRDHLVALHASMADVQTSRLVVGDGTVYLEGDCADVAVVGARLRYCVAYELRDDLISAMRCYGPLG